MGGLDILIIDDHAIVREGVKRILAAAPELRVAGEASSGTEAIDLVRSGQWDVILLDISLPGANGLEVLRAIQDHDANLPVLVLSMYPEDQYALRMLKAGARGYLEKGDAPGELVSAIRRVAAGGHYIGTGLAEKLGQDFQRSQAATR
ncbi:MAG: response regulator transcription factor [Betaproteobacteria bacterium]|nr:response regulator transcription factor [Betaproteobacteria bacterium]